MEFKMLKHTMKVLLLAGVAFTAVSFAADKMAVERAGPGIKMIKSIGNQNTTQAAAASGVSGTTYNGAFYASCASGFSKFGEQKDANQWTDWYVCGTPTIKCPAQIQANGRYSHVRAIATVKPNGNPDSHATTFSVQYKCDYSFNHIPPR